MYLQTKSFQYFGDLARISFQLILECWSSCFFFPLGTYGHSVSKVLLFTPVIYPFSSFHYMVEPDNHASQVSQLVAYFTPLGLAAAYMMSLTFRRLKGHMTGVIIGSINTNYYFLNQFMVENVSQQICQRRLSFERDEKICRNSTSKKERLATRGSLGDKKSFRESLLEEKTFQAKLFGKKKLPGSFFES